MAFAACAHRSVGGRLQGTPEAALVGEFEDDYGNRFTITDSEWLQQPNRRYHIVSWHSDAQYLIAQNDPANASEGGRWTRIDWMRFTGMPPYDWGFCLSAYAATSAAAAESVQVAQRATPRTGCNGHPFSRMKRAMPKGN